jgi:antitoxin HicB
MESYIIVGAGIAGLTAATPSPLARRLGVRETIVRRMLDPNHATKAEKLQSALTALGKRIVVALEDAA